MEGRCSNQGEIKCRRGGGFGELRLHCREAGKRDEAPGEVGDGGEREGSRVEETNERTT